MWPGTFSPIIMVQWKITLSERKLLLESEGPVFKFHDCGRKGKSINFLEALSSFHPTIFLIQERAAMGIPPTPPDHEEF